MASLDTACLDRLSAEADVPRQQVAQVLEGIEDFLSLNLQEASKDQLQVLRSRYTTRLNKSKAVLKALAEAKAAIDLLKADGHPQEPAVVVDKEVIEDIDANLDSQAVARSRLTPRPITTTGRLIVGDEQAA